MKTMTYVVANTFLWYAIVRLAALFFYRKARTSWTVRFGSFVALVAINSALQLALDSPPINLVCTVLLLFGWGFHFAGKPWQRLMAAVAPYACAMLVDSIAGNFLQKVLHTHVVAYNNVITAVLMFLLVMVLEKLFAGRLAGTPDLLHWLAIFLVPVGSIIIVVVAFTAEYSSTHTLLIVTILLLLNVLIFYLCDIVGRYYQQQQEQALIQQQNQSYVHQIEIIKASQESMRCLRHDYKNHLAAICALGQANRYSELWSYLDALSTYVAPTQEYVCTGNADVDSILNYKLNQAAQAGAQITAEAQIPAETGSIAPADITVIIGNLLDNATEAIATQQDKMLRVRLDYERGMLGIVVENACAQPPQLQGNRIATTKRDRASHGVGLESVRAVVQKYNGELVLEHSAETFTARVVLYT